MNISLKPITETLGVQVSGCDLTQPLSEEEQSFLRDALHRHGMLLFRGLDIDAEQQLRFALYFGNISKQGPVQESAPPVTYVSNSRADGTFGKGELSFHSDQCYYPHPMKAIMLYGLEVPSTGGETLFVNTAAVVASMPADVRSELAGYKVRHEMDYGALDYGDEIKSSVKPEKPAAEHPVIAKHPWSDAMVLMANCNTGKAIVGVTPEKSREVLGLIDRLVSEPSRIYRHKWQKGDLIIWDNLLLQHARSNFDPAEKRTLRRCAIGHELEMA